MPEILSAHLSYGLHFSDVDQDIKHCARSRSTVYPDQDSKNCVAFLLFFHGLQDHFPFRCFTL